MESATYYLDQQLKAYKAAITDAFKQFQLDDESRIAAAHAVLYSTLHEYEDMSHVPERDQQQAIISGMLSMAAACHLVSFDEIKEIKQRAGIDRIEIPFKMVF